MSAAFIQVRPAITREREGNTIHCCLLSAPEWPRSQLRSQLCGIFLSCYLQTISCHINATERAKDIDHLYRFQQTFTQPVIWRRRKGLKGPNNEETTAEVYLTFELSWGNSYQPVPSQPLLKLPCCLETWCIHPEMGNSCLLRLPRHET